jgi:hypothetical protein
MIELRVITVRSDQFMIDQNVFHYQLSIKLVEEELD